MCYIFYQLYISAYLRNSAQNLTASSDSGQCPNLSVIAVCQITEYHAREHSLELTE